MYSTLVESLKRLYRNKKVTKARLQTMVTNNTITEEELNYIIS